MPDPTQSPVNSHPSNRHTCDDQAMVSSSPHIQGAPAQPPCRGWSSHQLHYLCRALQAGDACGPARLAHAAH